MGFVSDKRLYLNEDRSKVVEEGPDARYLLVNEGGEVTDEDAKKYGLSASKAKASVADDEPKDAEAKQVAAPPENKAKTTRSEKAD